MGYRYTESNSYPQDFLEASYNTGWQDDIWADYKRVSIFAGHGTTNGQHITWGYPHDNRCSGHLGGEVRLGTLDGDSSTLFILFTSCNGTLGVNNYNFGNSRARQYLSFHNSPYIDDDEPRDFWTSCIGSGLFL